MNNMYIDLQFISERNNINALSEILKKEPSSYNEIGDKSKGGQILNFSQINFDLLYGQYEDTAELFSKFMILIKSVYSDLKEFLVEHNCNVSICIVIKDTENNLPCITLPRNAIRFLSELDADLDFDFI